LKRKCDTTKGTRLRRALFAQEDRIDNGIRVYSAIVAELDPKE